jgi:hypothetical protein
MKTLKNARQTAIFFTSACNKMSCQFRFFYHREKIESHLIIFKSFTEKVLNTPCRIRAAGIGAIASVDAEGGGTCKSLISVTSLTIFSIFLKRHAMLLLLLVLVLSPLLANVISEQHTTNHQARAKQNHHHLSHRSSPQQQTALTLSPWQRTAGHKYNYEDDVKRWDKLVNIGIRWVPPGQVVCVSWFLADTGTTNNHIHTLYNKWWY